MLDKLYEKMLQQKSTLIFNNGNNNGNNNSNNNLEKGILVVIKAEFCMFLQLSKPGIAFIAILFMKHHSIMAKSDKTNR
jgi:hypothetical protein